MPLNLSVATEDLGSSLKRAIGMAASMEVPGVRLNTRHELDVLNASESALRQTLHYVKERQMRVAGLRCPTRHSLYDPEFLEPRLDVVQRSMSLCRKLETEELIVRCGRIPDPDDSTAPQSADDDIHSQANPFSFESLGKTQGPTQTEEFSQLRQILNDLTSHANHVGCILNLQLADFNLPLIRRLLSEIHSGPIRVTFDSATAIMTGANVTLTYRDLYQHVGYVRARDAQKDVDGAGIETATGVGSVDWVEFIATLEEAGYQGWTCVERSGGENRTDDVRRGVEYLKRLISQEAQ